MPVGRPTDPRTACRLKLTRAQLCALLTARPDSDKRAFVIAPDVPDVTLRGLRSRFLLWSSGEFSGPPVTTHRGNAVVQALTESPGVPGANGTGIVSYADTAKHMATVKRNAHGVVVTIVIREDPVTGKWLAAGHDMDWFAEADYGLHARARWL